MANNKYKLTGDQYYVEECKKKTIIIHHTAGGPNPINVIHGWQFNQEKVATAFVIAGKQDKTKAYQEGEIFQAFEDKNWAHHIGLKTGNNTMLNQQSIAIEICNWGQLIMKEGKFYNYVNGEVPADEVLTLPIAYRGFNYYHKYSAVQLDSLRNLLIALCAKYNISTKYNENMFNVDSDALSGAVGIWTHTSYRSDKNDCSPQPALIQMLKNL